MRGDYKISDIDLIPSSLRIRIDGIEYTQYNIEYLVTAEWFEFDSWYNRVVKIPKKY